MEYELTYDHQGPVIRVEMGLELIGEWLNECVLRDNAAMDALIGKLESGKPLSWQEKGYQIDINAGEFDIRVAAEHDDEAHAAYEEEHLHVSEGQAGCGVDDLLAALHSFSGFVRR